MPTNTSIQTHSSHFFKGIKIFVYFLPFILEISKAFIPSSSPLPRSQPTMSATFTVIYTQPSTKYNLSSKTTFSIKQECLQNCKYSTLTRKRVDKNLFLIILSLTNKSRIIQNRRILPGKPMCILIFKCIIQFQTVYLFQLLG